jgi:hypothetical protein
MSPIDYFGGISKEDQGFECNPVIFFMTRYLIKSRDQDYQCRDGNIR